LSCEIVRINSVEPQPELVDYVVRCIDQGKMVGLPTDTFYGLAVDPVNLNAVESIYELKRRARNKPLSLMIDDMAQAYELSRDLDGRFDALAEKFWPGPLTLIVKAGTKLPLRVTANTGNVALRVPAAEIPRAVVRRFGRPITATSANLQNQAECTDAISLEAQLGHMLPMIVDGGISGQDIPTTIIDLTCDTGWEVIREGAIPTHRIALALQD
jgi:tRNA threonylcarbamoyl adenosine modification protein (Sua5/YciO/YrdC/YwlC family)